MINDQEFYKDRPVVREIEITKEEDELYLLFAENLGVSVERLMSCYIEMILYFEKFDIVSFYSNELDLMADDLGISLDRLLRGFAILKYKLGKLNRVN